MYVLTIDVPDISQPQHNISILLNNNSSVILQCRATGKGSLKYYWERNNSENWITVDNNNRTSYTTGTTGQYRCNVTNEAGSVVSPVITVYGKNVAISLAHDQLYIAGQVCIELEALLIVDVGFFNITIVTYGRS